MKEYIGKKAISNLIKIIKTDINTRADTAHTHASASQSSPGFMSIDDKKKLDGIGTGANKYTHPTYTEHAAALYKIESDATGHIKSATAVTKADITGLGIPAQDTKYTHPTTAGNKHIPAGGESGQILRWASDGTAAWGADNNTVYTPASAAPKANGTAAAGTSVKYAREDHVHPLQTSVSGNAGTATKATQDSSGQQINSTYIKALSVSGKVITYTKGDGTTGTITTQDTNTTYANMSGATSSAAGKAGLVPAPAAGKQTSFLRGDGTWVIPTNTTYAVATTSANGLMSTADKTKLDGIATGANKYTHPTTSGNKHIPSGGSSGQILRWSADGTAVWGNDNNTTYSNMTAATASAAGKAGLVPAPAAGKQTSFLRGDGTWVVPTNTTYSNMTGATASAAGKAGLAPAPAAGAQTKYLRGDGTWQTPPDTNTVYTHPTYTARTGKPTANATPGFGSTFTISQITSDATGHVTGATDRTVKIPNATASSSAAGLMSASDKTKLDLITKPATTGYVIQKDSTGYYIEV